MANRRVVIGDDKGGVAHMELGPVKIPRRTDGRIIQPTGDRRHMTGIRLGRISFEVFSRKDREKIPVDFDARDDRVEIPMDEPFEPEIEPDEWYDMAAPPVVRPAASRKRKRA